MGLLHSAISSGLPCQAQVAWRGSPPGWGLQGANLAQHGQTTPAELCEIRDRLWGSTESARGANCCPWRKT